MSSVATSSPPASPPPPLPDLGVTSLFSQQGKTVLVTGGGTGLGLIIATAFAQNGAKVYIASRKMSNLSRAAADLNALRPGCCIPLTADLTSKSGCDALGLELASREPGGLDVLVNNSGVSWGSALDDVDEARGWDRVFSVNVKSLFYLTVAVLPLLRKRASEDRPASVINVTSIYASLPLAYMPTAPRGHGAWSYLASKGAAAHLTRSLSIKLKPMNINVNAIAPGFFPSNMTATGLKPVSSPTSSDSPSPSPSPSPSQKPRDALSLSHPAGRLGSPQHIAGPALLLASRAGAHMSGTTVTVDGGFSMAPISRLPEELRSLFSPPAAKL